MNKPFVTCHMYTSIDGKIDGTYMEETGCDGSGKYYDEKIFQIGTAMASGRVTTCLYKAHGKENLEGFQEERKEDYILKSEYYNFIFDRMGKCFYTDSTYEYGGRKMQLVEVVSSEVDGRYLSYLKSRKIAYIIADDIKSALDKIRSLFGVQRLVLTGGTWAKTGSIKGATGETGAKGDAGEDGASVLSGSGIPAEALGSNGDTYLDVATGDIYKKTDGAWAKTGSIKGSTGETGAKGDKGDTGNAGYSTYIVDSTNKTFDIYDVFGMISFNNYFANGFSYEGWTVNLENDVDLANYTWTPIGTETSPFKGTFNGNDKTINHLALSSTDYFQGSIGVLDGGVVKNIKFENVNLSGVNKSGCAVGEVINNGTVSYIAVNSGTIIGGTKTIGSCVGMIKAYGTVDHCTNHVDITSSGTNVGGIIGAAYYTEEGQEMYVKDNENYGKIIGGHPAGGIVGLSTGNVSGNHNYADVKGTIGTSTGGIVGEQKSYGIVESNTNEGNVVNADGQYGVGGVIGWIRYHGSTETASYKVSVPIEVRKNVNKGSVSGGNDGGGIVGTIYNNALLVQNENYAATLSGITFAAGIVGNYQDTETPANASITNAITLTGNTSTTTIENINAPSKDLILYNNDAEHVTPVIS
ncbi:MAG: hypothetical protein LKE52_00220 [Bacilli bacterium]|nr:hypothetical protein [Bacilli bacterium]